MFSEQNARLEIWIPFQLKLPPSEVVFAPVTVESHNAISADPGTLLPIQLFLLLRFWVLFFLVIVAALEEPADAISPHQSQSNSARRRAVRDRVQ
ncbi:MAG: hypothetical protein ABJB69_06665 [Spartobacteria bacterium]